MLTLPLLLLLLLRAVIQCSGSDMACSLYRFSSSSSSSFLQYKGWGAMSYDDFREHVLAHPRTKGVFAEIPVIASELRPSLDRARKRAPSAKITGDDSCEDGGKPQKAARGGGGGAKPPVSASGATNKAGVGGGASGNDDDAMITSSSAQVLIDEIVTGAWMDFAE